ncbi:TVG0732301 [Thermoplasma volcanium GSS1]|uniref:TVG0732301 protein n=1 Tax=Thermoplasma volcanium (strain ATCC 51530 / DSM 4299 / JCM 9571 / NBRC 15438 / GSS1) TaxID=273116 RepID=Q97AT4_THEVO|nr:hypothetical protein [Thermoplasma volcanium]BAB59867.1 TVG0732301 [Thermoplasma volcanium GSS1]
MNFSRYVNSVSYVYGALPVMVYKAENFGYFVPFALFLIFKVRQKTDFPFFSTLLYGSIQVGPVNYINSHEIVFAFHTYGSLLNLTVQVSLFIAVWASIIFQFG